MTWSDDRDVGFTRWSTGQPDNHIVLGEDGESCTQIYPNQTWNDNKCASKMTYMCKKYKGRNHEELRFVQSSTDFIERHRATLTSDTCFPQLQRVT